METTFCPAPLPTSYSHRVRIHTSLRLPGFRAPQCSLLALVKSYPLKQFQGLPIPLTHRWVPMAVQPQLCSPARGIHPHPHPRAYLLPCFHARRNSQLSAGSVSVSLCLSISLSLS